MPVVLPEGMRVDAAKTRALFALVRVSLLVMVQKYKPQHIAGCRRTLNSRPGVAMPDSPEQRRTPARPDVLKAPTGLWQQFAKERLTAGVRWSFAARLSSSLQTQ